MKRLILLLLLLIPSIAFGTFTEFYCNASTGDNTNGGSSAGSVVFSNTNANWDGTSVFTPNNGQNPVSQGVTTGMFAAIFLDGAATATRIARITNVTNATNGAITVSTTSVAGASVTSGATGRTIRVGGAWKGPNGAVGFPWTINSLGTATDGTNMVRVNFKNNADYSISSAITFGSTGGNVVSQGYSSTPGDLGKATITTTTNAVGIIGVGTTNRSFYDLRFTTTATSGSAVGVVSTSFNTFQRCVFNGWRSTVISQGGGAPLWVDECEFYDFNKANTVGASAINGTSGLTVTSSYFHDATAGSNCLGISTASGNHTTQIIGNIFDNLAGAAVQESGGGAGDVLTIITNNDFYHCNTGIKLNATAASTYHPIIKNNNFIGNTTYAIDVVAGHVDGTLFNNGYGSGTEANGSGDYHTTAEMILDDATGNNSRVVYAANATPYAAPTTGNFKINNVAAMGTGRGHFEQNDGTNTDTVGYPDIGAAQHNDTCSGLGPCQTSGASAQ